MCAQLADPAKVDELAAGLEELADAVLVPRAAAEGGADSVGYELRFDQLITGLALLAPRFAFELPPYFLNNARALATLEGMARSADPTFDVLQAVYPFALRRLLTDPRGSPLMRKTLVSLTHDERGRLDLARLRRLLRETSRLTGRRRARIVLDGVMSAGGRAFARDVAISEGKQALKGLAWRPRRR
jgi:predicted unusual protein kinase regulating ubiquinone biosynthesis (AarF/ABC1/UbiB family)